MTYVQAVLFPEQYSLEKVYKRADEKYKRT
jgi:hypothetical protein